MTGTEKDKKAKRESARLERLEQAKRRQRAKRRKQLLVAIPLMVALAGGTAFLVQKKAAAKKRAGVALKAAGCGSVLSFANLGQDHLQGPGKTYDKYNSSPPTSGPHSPQPARWGSSSQTIPKETLVHNLEHGGVVVHYKGLSNQQIDELDKLVDAHADGVVDNPNQTIDQPIVMTAWTKMEKCKRFSIPAIKGFVALNCGKGPEKVATCR